MRTESLVGSSDASSSDQLEPSVSSNSYWYLVWLQGQAQHQVKLPRAQNQDDSSCIQCASHTLHPRQAPLETPQVHYGFDLELVVGLCPLRYLFTGLQTFSHSPHSVIQPRWGHSPQCKMLSVNPELPLLHVLEIEPRDTLTRAHVGAVAELIEGLLFHLGAGLLREPPLEI